MANDLRTKLADTLAKATKTARSQVVKTSWLVRADREFLTERGYLQEIVKGWYILGRPVDKPGDSTAWYAVFWNFLSVYLEERFGSDYCLSAGSSLDLHIGANVVPQQVVAMTARGGVMSLNLPHQTSLLVYQDGKNIPASVETVRGVRVMPLVLAICRIPPVFFEKEPLNAEIALRAVKSVDDLIRHILDTNSPALAGRLAGAYQFLGDKGRADQIINASQAAGIDCHPKNPFLKASPILDENIRLMSPYAGRIEALFKTARGPLLEVFKDMPPTPISKPEAYLNQVEAVYEHDAYNSLSIEGYQVTPELIAKIRKGVWNPDGDPQDRQQVAAMAAKGYWLAFRAVQKSVGRVLNGENAGQVVRKDYQPWYRALFSESVRAGILASHHLAGHRNGPVYIRASRHVPLPHEAVNDAMEALLDSLENEPEPIVRAVLGHWLFGFIHPYTDGNGRMARFLMNVMMASGGYPWTIVRTVRRKQYLAALDAASVGQDILPFANFIREEMNVDWSREPARG
jgi:hypothetical protein